MEAQPQQPQTSPGEGDPELLDLTLEELLEVKVTVASKQEETALNAPGMVTVYTAAQVQRYGYYTLADLAEVTPGYSSYTLFGERVFETRGQKAGSFNNNKHLLLIDDIPVNHAKSDKAPIDTELPVYFADRIEFLRGPSSTLYGTSAFFGVVSVRPKALDEEGSAYEAKISAGLPIVDPDDSRYQLQRRVMANALERTEYHQLSLNGGYYGQRPSEQVAGDTGEDRPTTYAPPAQTRMWDDHESVFLRAADTVVNGPLEGLTVAVMYMDRTTGHGDYFLGDLYTHENAELRWTEFIPYVKYERALANDVALRSFVKYNLSRESGRLIRFGADGFVAEPSGAIFAVSSYNQFAHAVEGLTEVTYSPLDFVNLLGGIDLETRKQSPGTTEGYSFIVLAEDGAPPPVDVELGSGRLTTMSAFGEVSADLDVLSGLSLTAGVRGALGFAESDQFNHISPRGTAVLKPTQRTALKLLYSSALRQPSLKELNLNDEARSSLQRRGADTSGIQPLEAERIQELEAVVAYESTRLSGSTAVFYNRTENPLDGVPYLGENIFANTDSQIEAVGIEGELRTRPLVAIPVTANASLARAVDETDAPVNDVPILKANLGVGYQLKSPLDLELHFWLKWISGYRSDAPEFPGTDGHLTLDANLIGKISSDLSAELLVRNITNEEYFFPFQGLPRAPGMRRTALFTLALANPL